MTSEKEAMERDESLGSINISPEVIESIANGVIQQVKEVHPLAWYKGRPISELFSKDKPAVLYQNDQGETVLKVAVAMQYGSNVPKVAFTLQKQVEEEVYYMTELHLDQVNVVVSELVVPSDSSH